MQMELLILSLIQIESRKDGLKICVNCLFKLEKKPLKKTYNKFEESLTPRSFLHLRKAPKKLRPYSKLQYFSIWVRGPDGLESWKAGEHSPCIG